MDRMDQDEGETLWHIVYTDFDEEQVDKQQLCDILAYHPLVDTHGDIDVPTVGSFVWFNQKQQPALGQVVSVDPSVPRPIVVHLFRPQSNANGIARARFQAAIEPQTGEPLLCHLTLHQIQLRFPSLTSRGYLAPRDRSRLLSLISG